MADNGDDGTVVVLEKLLLNKRCVWGAAQASGRSLRSRLGVVSDGSGSLARDLYFCVVYIYIFIYSKKCWRRRPVHTFSSFLSSRRPFFSCVNAFWLRSSSRGRDYWFGLAVFCCHQLFFFFFFFSLIIDVPLQYHSSAIYNIFLKIYKYFSDVSIEKCNLLVA